MIHPVTSAYNPTKQARLPPNKIELYSLVIYDKLLCSYLGCELKDIDRQANYVS